MNMKPCVERKMRAVISKAMFVATRLPVLIGGLYVVERVGAPL